MTLQMKSMLALIGFVWAVAQAANAQSVGSTSIRDGFETVLPPEFRGAIKNGSPNLLVGSGRARCP